VIDPRGPRFVAWVTSVVLALVLLTQSAWLLGLQALVFAIGAILGVQRGPYGLVFRSLIRPRLAPPAELEAAEPPRFAQAVGTVFAVAGVIGFAAGSAPVGLVATAFALAAALLNAAFGFCLGCELYLFFRKNVSNRNVNTFPQGKTNREVSA
jgi:ammonia channel protein AmtB